MTFGDVLRDRAQQTGARWAPRLGRLTADRRMLPTFLIAGGQRCGTTSMFKALIQHPGVLRPPLHKGIHYFDVGYQQPLQWYRAHFPLEYTASRHSWSGRPAITGESSPYYLFHPLAPGRIAEVLPGVKVVVLVRDPVERAYSAHSHELARGYETEPDFERALELEPDRLRGQEELLTSDPNARSHSHQHHAYLTRGRYADYLERMAAAVGRDNVHVVDSQRFFEQPAEQYAAVLAFLGLTPGPSPAFDKHNSRSRSPMSEQLRARLTAEFTPYDERLLAWLGAPPSWRGAG